MVNAESSGKVGRDWVCHECIQLHIPTISLTSDVLGFLGYEGPAVNRKFFS